MTVSDIARSVLSDPRVQEGIAAVTSEIACKIYLVTGLVLLLAYSVRQAQRLDGLAKDFEFRLKDADKDFEVKYPGIKPFTVAGLKKRISAVENVLFPIKSELNQQLVRYGVGLLVYGFAIPSIVIIMFFFAYGWIFPHGHALADLKQNGENGYMLVAKITLVVVQQLALGVEGASRGLALALSPLTLSTSDNLPTYNSADPLVNSIILFYRIAVGGFLLTIFSMMGRYISIRLLEPKQLRDLRKKLSAAEKANANS